MSGSGSGWDWEPDAEGGDERRAAGGPIPSGNPYASGEYLDDDAHDTGFTDEGDAGYTDEDDAGFTDEDDGGFDAPEPADVPLDDRPHGAGDPGPVADRYEWAADVEADADFPIDDGVPPELVGSTSLGDDRPPPPRRSNRFTRLLVLLVLLGMLAGGIALERREPATTDARVTTEGLDGPEVPPDTAVSTAWYCAAGTATTGGAADETIHVANLSPDPITADVTVDPGGGAAARTSRLQIDAYARGNLAVSRVLNADSPGVVVEVEGGAAVVEHEIRGNGDVAMSPCATEPARSWYFAAGGTQEGSTETLELFNPFGDDAVVDIAFLTEGGVQEPQELQGFVVGRRSKVSVAVGDLVARQERVAAVVHTRAGRVVAEEIRSFDGTGGRTGLALSLGSAAPRREWTLPVAAAEPGATGVVAVANFGLRPTSVEVSALLSGDGVLTPETVEVPARSVVHVDLSPRIPAGTAYSVVVRSLGTVEVVAESILDTASGAATSGGAALTARRWALAGAPRDASSAVVATNRGTAPITVELRAYVAGDADGPTSAPAIAVEPGKTARFDLDEWGIDPDQVLVVSADGPIAVGRETYAGGVSLALAVPFRD